MMVSDNSHLTRFGPSHYDPPAMKRVASGILPLSSSYSDQPTRQGFILGFGSTELADIPRTVRKLRSLLPREERPTT
jgi:hypothetical protein